MLATNNSSGIDAFQQWKKEHQVIDKYTAELEVWIATQSKVRAQQFQQTVQKLNELNEQLQAHFTREDLICKNLDATHRDCPLDSDAVKRQIDRDHTNISNRLKQLIDRMQEAECEMDNWKTSVHELQLILDLVEQHDEQEFDSVSCLLTPRVQPSPT
jgi:predicted RNase H-like nuclease (RuvC/YqgF family)